MDFLLIPLPGHVDHATSIGRGILRSLGDDDDFDNDEDWDNDDDTDDDDPDEDDPDDDLDDFDW